MNNDPEFVWSRTLAALAAVALLAFALDAWAGWTWALGLACAGLLVILARHLAKIAALARWLRDTTQPVPDAGGVWEKVFADLYRMVRDHRAERKLLAEALVRFRSAGMAMPDGVVILDSSNHIEWCNPVAEQYFDLDSEKDAGQAIVNLVRAPGFGSYLDQGNFAEPLILRVSRGELLALSIRVVPYGEDQKLMLCRDVTQAEKLDNMRRDFVANVSHELRTPLTVVSGFLETLGDGKLKLSEKRGREILALMQDQTGRMLRLIEDLLTLSTLESETGPHTESQFEIGGLLSSLTEEARALSAGRHRVVVTVGPPALVTGNSRELHSAFGNLVSNAVRYTPEGGTVELAWEIRDSGEGAFSVTDNGIGIEARHLPRLTERFYRVDQSRSRETGGTGLGLAIVKHILTHHQGALDIQSEQGSGSRFTAVLPARRVAPQVGPQTSPAPDAGPAIPAPARNPQAGAAPRWQASAAAPARSGAQTGTQAGASAGGAQAAAGVKVARS